MSGATPPSPSPSTDSARRSGEGWLRRLTREYVWRYRRNVVVAFGAALLGTLVTVAAPLVQRRVIDDLVSGGGRLAPLLVLLAVAGALRFGFGFVRRYVGGRLALDVQYDLRDDVFRALQRIDGARQDELQTGQLVSRASSDITLIQGLLAFLPNMSGNFLLFVLAIVVMVVLSPLLTVVALLVGPAMAFIAIRSRRRLFPATWDAQQQAAGVAGVVEEDVTGVRVVKGFGQESREVARLETAAGRLFASRMRAVRLTARYSPALQAVPALGQVGVLGLGGWMVLEGRITLGTFLAFSTYLAELVAPVRILAGLLTMGQQARAGAVRVLEVIDSRPDVRDAPGAVQLPPLRGRVELDDVTFGYLRSQPVLRGLDLTVEPGERVALVGASGSGKSTISLLLPRFYDVQAGSVRVDGHDVRDVTTDSLRRQIGVVFEDAFLFSRSVRENIAYGAPDVTQEAVEAAARLAEADGFIRALPQGYDTVVGEQGLTLSGGQRQRIALARALLSDPRILVLDDATSAVDARVEAEIFAALRHVMRGRTTILIAHRRSTLELADRIAVLDGGRVVDTGTSEELLERCPLFRQLLGGPGPDVEGVDAPLSAGPVEPQGPGRPDARHQADPREPGDSVGGPGASVPAGVRGSAVAPQAVAPQGVAGQGVVGRGVAGPGVTARRPASTVGGTRGMAPRGMGGGPMGGMLAGLPATPELLAAVDALSPATDVPDVDLAAASRPDPAFSLARLIRPLWVALAAALALVALDTAASLSLPALVRSGVDASIGSRDGRLLAVVTAVALVIVLADWVVTHRQTLVTGRLGERLLFTLRVKTFAQLQRLGLDYYERELAGRIMTRMTTDVDALSSFLQQGVTTTFVSLLSLFGVLVALFVLDVRLALATISVLPVLVVATVLFRARSSRAYAQARERISAVNADLQENLSGVRVAQSFTREDRNTERFRELSDSYRQSRLRAQHAISLYFPFVEGLSQVTAVIVLGVGAGLVHRGTLTTGTLIAFLLYVNTFFAPVQSLSQVFDGYQQAAVGLRRIGELLRLPTSTPDAADPVPVPARFRGEVELCGVSFRYDRAKTDALHGITLRVPAGQSVALVGETGAGKSTLVKLLARYYDVTAGEVMVDGTDVRRYALEAYRQRLGVVPQEPFLFAGTVADNIAYGRPDADAERVRAAARAVGADDMIRRLPAGYDTQVGERGRALSAGQRQLVSLARAELVEPDLLLLDEATAALDLLSEAAYMQAVEAVAGRRTTFVVAHRLSTAARADRILVLDGGTVVEDGTHEELLAGDGRYAQLWAVYAGGAPEDGELDAVSDVVA